LVKPDAQSQGRPFARLEPEKQRDSPSVLPVKITGPSRRNPLFNDAPNDQIPTGSDDNLEVG